MAAPRFTLRQLLVVTFGIALAALVTSWGGQALAWLVGITSALVALLVIALVHAVLFFIVWLWLPNQPAAPRSRVPNPSPASPPS